MHYENKRCKLNQSTVQAEVVTKITALIKSNLHNERQNSYKC